MDNQLVADNVCSFLNLRDLKNFRQVNSYFLRAANKEMQKRAPMLSFCSDSKDKKKLTLKDFYLYIQFNRNKGLGCPFRKISLTTSMLCQDQLRSKFIEFCCDKVTHLKITQDEISEAGFRCIEDDAVFQHFRWNLLQSIEIVTDVSCNPFLGIVFVNAPNLKECKVYSRSSVGYLSLENFVEAYRCFQVPKLVSIELRDTFSESSFRCLRELNLTLKKLCLVFNLYEDSTCSELSELLKAYGASIEKLEIIGNKNLSYPGFVLPIMPKLTQLSIYWKLRRNETIRFAGKTFLKQFPVLEELKWDTPVEIFHGLLSQDLTGIKNMKSLRIRDTGYFPVHLYEVNLCFTNLCNLEIDYNEDTLQIVFKSFTSLQYLTIINNSGNEKITAALIGVNPLCCDIVITTEDLEEFGKRYNLYHTYPAIHNLKNLKKLRIMETHLPPKTACMNELSFRFGFFQMPSLQTIDFENSIFRVSSGCLQQIQSQFDFRCSNVEILEEDGW